MNKKFNNITVTIDAIKQYRFEFTLNIIIQLSIINNAVEIINCIIDNLFLPISIISLKSFVPIFQIRCTINENTTATKPIIIKTHKNTNKIISVFIDCDSAALEYIIIKLHISNTIKADIIFAKNNRNFFTTILLKMPCLKYIVYYF